MITPIKPQVPPCDNGALSFISPDNAPFVPLMRIGGHYYPQFCQQPATTRRPQRYQASRSTRSGWKAVRA